jgi:hypothetical protein
MISWDAIGALGEILGAVAVLVTLLYLAAQIRLSNRYESAAHLDIHMDRIRTFIMNIAENPELSSIWRRGRAGESLSEDAQERFNHLAFTRILTQRDGWLRAQILGSVEGVDDPEMYLELLAFEIRTHPGLLKYWDDVFRNNRIKFNKEFVGLVNANLEEKRKI